MSERRLFGTDGVRGVANRYPMTAEVALRLGRAVGYLLRREHAAAGRAGRPCVVIGKDTRVSGYMIEHALVAGLCSAGVDSSLAGPLPTPGVAFLTVSRRADAGLVISASHNPFEDNGVKIFARDGYKLPDALEGELEALMESAALDELRPTGEGVGRAARISDAVGRYNVAVKAAFPQHLTLSGLRVAVDCAHGAAYKVAPEVLAELGAEVIAVGVSPNGLNINDSCGATHPEALAEVVRREGAHVGVCLDGDADRCILLDERGEALDGDQILAVLARALQAQGRLRGGRVVTTVMSNLGLEAALAPLGVGVERVQVGDRYVVARMREAGLNLGGEQSGHTILQDYATTGDGLVAALAVLGVAVGEGRPLSALGAEMTRFPQVLKSFEVAGRPPLASLAGAQRAIREAEAALGTRGRVLVRYSGTQAMARVMVEGPALEQVEGLAARISEALVDDISARVARGEG
ncbi:MAG: phosphoglucosamine mutase [Deltaproteobacteria bacterium]|nr:phosphoglucosamine mutase [Deltaproteobacteria bacterium]